MFAPNDNRRCEKMSRKIIIDLCCGLGGFSQAFRDDPENWKVITFDIEGKFNPSYTYDIVKNKNKVLNCIMEDAIITRHDFYKWEKGKPLVDLIVASPPCTQFTRYSMPSLYPEYENYQNGTWYPDMSIVKSAYEIIREVKPKYWIMENVRGSVNFISEELQQVPRKKIGTAWFFWGNFPLFEPADSRFFRKDVQATRSPALRSLIPYEISKCLKEAVESQKQLDLYSNFE